MPPNFAINVDFYILAKLNQFTIFMNTFSIQHQLTLKEYRKIYFTLLYRKVLIIVISILAVAAFISLCILWSTGHSSILNNDSSEYAMVLVFLAMWIPLGSLFTVWRGFKSNYRLNELITYEFSDEGYTTTGESFNSKVDWTKVYKVQVLKDWLILYHSRTAANMIVTGTANKENIEALKQFLKAGNFKAKLKW